MRHHALLVSHQSNERVDVTLDVVDGHVEMFVAETSVGRWPIARFVAAPGLDGFQITSDGDTWTVDPRDRALFEADALSRLARRSRAYLVNRYPRATRAFDATRNGGMKRNLTRLLTVSGLGILSFGFGIIAGRFRLDGGNVSAWIFLGFVLGGSVLVTQLLSAPTQPVAHSREPRDQAALDHLMSTLQFQEPSPPPPLSQLSHDAPPTPSADESHTVPAASADEPATTETSPAPEAPTEATAVTGDAEGLDSERPGDTEPTEQPSLAPVSPEPQKPAKKERPEAVRLRVERPAHPEPAVDRGRIRLPGTRQQFPRLTADADQDSTHPVFSFEVEPADDLTSIHGIGPTFAALLHDVGIRSFRQLASIDDATLSALRDLMGPFAGRIERDGWIEGAARAHREQRERRALPTG